MAFFSKYVFMDYMDLFQHAPHVPSTQIRLLQLMKKTRKKKEMDLKTEINTFVVLGCYNVYP